MTVDLSGRAARGALSTGVGLVARMSIQLASVVLLARLLGPSDYGIVAMAVAVVGIGDTIRDFGLSSAAIQAPDLSRAQRSNLFWTNTMIGVALGLLVLACSGAVAAFYSEPALVGVTQALAGTFLLNGMTTQYRASLIRAMRFRVVAAIDVVAPASGLVVAFVLASSGAGYWALVAQQLVQAAVALVAAVAMGRWLPGRYDRTVPMRHLFRFGGHLLGSQLVGYLANNIDSLVIGRRFGAYDLGTYNRAFQLLMNPLGQVRAPSTTVALPVLSRAGPGRQFDRIVRSGQLVLAYPVALALGLVVGMAVPLVAIMLGPDWSAVPPLLRLLAVAGIFQTLSYVGYWVYLARGLTRELLQYTFASAAIRITCVLVGSAWGVIGVAAGYALAPMLAWPLSLWWLSRVTPLPVRALYGGALRALLVAVVAASASAATVSALVPHGPVWQLAAGAAAGIAASCVLLVLPAIRRDARELVHAARAALRRRSA